MKLLAQPTKNSCGQTCVAMITGRPIKEICELIGRSGPTSHKDLQNALAHFGMTFEKYLRSEPTPLDPSKIYVPLKSKILLPIGAYITSYLVIEDEEKTDILAGSTDRQFSYDSSVTDGSHYPY